MAYRQTSQISATTGGKRRRLNQIEAMNARLDFLPQIEAMKSEKKYQAASEAREVARDTAAETRYQAGLVKTKETEALAATKYAAAEKFKKKQTKTALGLEATKLGTTLTGTGPTISSVPGSLKSTFGGSPMVTTGNWQGISDPGAGSNIGPSTGNWGKATESSLYSTKPTTTTTGGRSGGFWNKAKAGLGGTTVGSALGTGLTGYGAAQIFSDKSEKTKLGWGALAGGLAGLASGGLGGMFSGALFGGIGGGLA